MAVLIIDNYDSFTFNLYQMAGSLTGQEPIVVKNDALEWSEINKIATEAIILSPGPGRPERKRDFGVCREILANSNVPILGVCLGHQGIGDVFGGKVVHAPEPMHGRISRIYHDNDELWHGVANGFRGVRYHSLIVADPTPSTLKKIAWTEEGLIMGLRHATRPIWGVQFHPESICTESGVTILQNFLKIAGIEKKKAISFQNSEKILPSRQEVFFRRIEQKVEPEDVFAALFAEKEYSAWLDKKIEENRSVSFLGTTEGREAEVVRYYSVERKLEIERPKGVEVRNETIFDYLSNVLREKRTDAQQLPFDFNGGYCGYFGYGLKAECGYGNKHVSSEPDAMFIFVNRMAVVDWSKGQVYLAYVGKKDETELAEEWFDRALAQMERPRGEVLSGKFDKPIFFPILDAKQYEERIQKSLEHIRNGESYEICMTTHLEAQTDAEPLPYYLNLRRQNPAPHSAFMQFGALGIASSSPEQFLKIDRQGWVESRPIKGTVSRGKTDIEDKRLAQALAQEEKTRVENLMIVDLVRNDLGRVCELGSVTVPKLMEVESYATVHQLVSTVRGKLAPGMTGIDCIRAAFPPGSMTGAPKARTIEILDGLETKARGIYSGALGFLALNGAIDLSVVIRTAIFKDGEVSIGVGGAIVALSDTFKEIEEAVLKGRALIEAFGAKEKVEKEYPAAIPG